MLFGACLSTSFSYPSACLDGQTLLFLEHGAWSLARLILHSRSSSLNGQFAMYAGLLNSLLGSSGCSKKTCFSVTTNLFSAQTGMFNGRVLPPSYQTNKATWTCAFSSPGTFPPLWLTTSPVELFQASVKYQTQWAAFTSTGLAAKTIGRSAQMI